MNITPELVDLVMVDMQNRPCDAYHQVPDNEAENLMYMTRDAVAVEIYRHDPKQRATPITLAVRQMDLFNDPAKHA